jgi:polyisoprenoid-binding protein YceI
MLPHCARSAAAVLTAWLAILLPAAPAWADRFEFDSRRTEVRFVYTMGLATQRGRFTRVSGTLDLDEAKPERTRVVAAIAAESLTTGEPLVDTALKGAAFFNVKASPVIAFKSRSVRLGRDLGGDVLGDITVNGITRPVTLKVSVVPHDDPALKHDAGARAFVGRTRILRSQFNMTDYQSMVADEVDIEILAIARPHK